MSRLARRIEPLCAEPTIQRTASTTDTALCVDLDGTLIATDLVWESVLWVLKRAPWLILLLPFWLAGGRATLKARLADRVEVDVASLPYRPEILDWVRREHARGRRCVLVTGSHRKVAEAVAAHVAAFGEVLATDGTVNLTGRRKQAILEERFGAGHFDYVGNGRADLSVWRAARIAYVVSASPRLPGRVAAPLVRRLPVERPGIPTVLRAIRVHQWIKNVLVFAPLVLAHESFHLPELLRATAAFLAFSLCASSVYVLNDLLDLRADRAHPLKRTRPFAAGALSIPAGLLLIPLLLGAAFATSLALPPAFTASLAGYLMLTTAYSFWLKGVAAIDVVVLAVLYTLRVLAGGLAVDVPVSPWLMALSIFLFQSLAVQKRYTELALRASEPDERLAGRGYVKGDGQLLATAGAASGYMAVLVLALYINGDEVTRLYAQPKVLWAICPMLLYWITHMWLLAHRGQVTDDPIVVALTDRASWIVGVAVLVTMALAITGWDIEPTVGSAVP
jgi:4-hydroxybenzoate polyprenyltransferase/phosphoserine phosphatase